MDCSTAGFPVQHQLPELAQIHVHWVRDAIQPSHHLSSPFPPAFNLSQHLGLFQSQFFTSGGQSIGVSASIRVLPMNTQGWSPLEWTGWTPCSPRDSQKCSPAPQFKSINSLAFSFLYSSILTSSERWLHGAGEVRGREEIPHAQGQRNCNKTVGTERGHQRTDRQKPQWEKTNQCKHLDHRLV